MKKMIIAIFSAVFLLNLVGCGVKGPLYFPDNSENTSEQTTAQ
ncbi:LPS translocon maturation chaperone LptM [Spirabiliibacterium falconis]|nr:lipoprotein [Spirabiliibacterium falconis]MBE2894638.1 hypothetical protein [Spirabiliibacterium falconis]